MACNGQITMLVSRQMRVTVSFKYTLCKPSVLLFAGVTTATKV